MKDFRTFLVLSVIFGVLLVTFILQDRMLPQAAQPNTPTPEPALERLFPELRVLDLAAVQLLDPITGRTFTMARGGTGQWLAADREGVLDADVATTIARYLVLMPYRRSIEIETDTNLQQYGFRPQGDFYIQFTTVDGGQHVIAIGEPTFDSPTFYTLVDDRPTVYLVERAPVDFLVEQFLNPPVSEAP